MLWPSRIRGAELVDVGVRVASGIVLEPVPLQPDVMDEVPIVTPDEKSMYG